MAHKDVDFTEVTSSLLVGADLSPDEDEAEWQLDRLVTKYGVTAIMDVREEVDDWDFVKQHYPEVAYCWNPADDHGGELPEAWWWKGLWFARASLAGGMGRRLYVHCHMGVNRSPSMAYAVLVDYYGMHHVDAYKLIREKRPDAFAIYSDQVLPLLDRQFGQRNKRALRNYMAQDHSHDDIVKVVGRKRKEEGRYAGIRSRY